MFKLTSTKEPRQGWKPGSKRGLDLRWFQQPRNLPKQFIMSSVGLTEAQEARKKGRAQVDRPPPHFGRQTQYFSYSATRISRLNLLLGLFSSQVFQTHGALKSAMPAAYKQMASKREKQARRCYCWMSPMFSSFFIIVFCIASQRIKGVSTQ